jgi:hypothetical protein
MVVVECQDVARFKEPRFEDKDVGFLETSLLVVGGRCGWCWVCERFHRSGSLVKAEKSVHA